MYPNSYMQNFLTQAKKDIAWIFEKTNWIFCSCFETERNHKVQYDYDNKLFLLK